MSPRTFESGPARREGGRIAIGIVGPSGSGKTLSAILLGEGMARVAGGETWLIDTNNRRSLHHADAHVFNVVHMPPPFSPEDCQAACQHAIDRGARRIIFDSISDMHEGEGGILQMHEDYIDQKTNHSEDWKTRDKQNMTAWKVVKRKQLMFKLWMFQQPIDWILTFRAKEKIKLESGGKPVDMGWQPLGPEELVYEMLFMCLLPPRADGRPIWTSNIVHEELLMKLPGWFRGLFSDRPQLSADIGEKLARWAAGADISPAGRSPTATTSPRTSPAPTLTERFDACTSFAEWIALDEEAEAQWRKATPAQREKNVAGRERMVSARSRARARVERDPDRQPMAPGEPSLEEQAEIARQEAALGA